MHALILCGFKGAGKTTWGKAFSMKYNFQFVDTDYLICEKFGSRLSISEIYRKYGASKFCEEEARVIKNILPTEQPLVVSTGGGAVLNYDSVMHLRKIGKIVYLRTAPEVLYARWMQLSNRPALLDGVEDTWQAFCVHYASRVDYYPSIADVSIDMAEPDVLSKLYAVAMGKEWVSNGK